MASSSAHRSRESRLSSSSLLHLAPGSELPFQGAGASSFNRSLPHLDAVHGFAANAAIIDDVGQLGVLPADCRGQLIHHVCHVVHRGARSLVENGRTEDLRPLAESEH